MTPVHANAGFQFLSKGYLTLALSIDPIAMLLWRLS